MKNLLVIPKMMIGPRPTLYGFDDEERLFKKTMSKRLADNLNQTFKEKNLTYEAFCNTEHHLAMDDLTKEYDFLLFSPYIVDRVDFNPLNEGDYYILSIEEFEEGKTEKIVCYLNSTVNSARYSSEETE